MSENIVAAVKAYGIYLFCPLLALVLSLVFTRLLIDCLPRFGFIDRPGGRHIHKKVTPRGGGIGVIAAFFMALYVYINISKNDFPTIFFGGLFPASAFLCIFGLIDDRFSLTGKIKLLGQIAAGVILWCGNIRVEYVMGCHLPWGVSLAFTVMWTVGFINAFNLIDGMDGLSSGLAIIAGFGMMLWAWWAQVPYVAAIICIFIGACAGFLRYNFAPARIFLGDTGSMFLGLFFAAVSLAGVGKRGTVIAIMAPLLAAAVPLFDVFLAFFRRTLRKFYPNIHRNGGIMQADKEHLHHRMLSSVPGVSDHERQRAAALRIYVLAVILCVGGFFVLVLMRRMPTVGALVLIAFLAVVLRYCATSEFFDFSRMMIHALRRPRKSAVFIVLMPLLDIAGLLAAYVLTLLLMNSLFVKAGSENVIFSLPRMLVVTLPVIIIFFVSGVYRLYLLRVMIRDFQRVAEALLAGCFISVVAQYLLFYFRSGHIYCFAEPVLFTLLAALFLIGGRMMIWYFSSYVISHLLLSGGREMPLRRVLLVGGGTMSRLFIESNYMSRADIPDRIIGILDDDRVLKSMSVYGVRVLGSTGDIERIYADRAFDVLVLTTPFLSKEKLAYLENFCSAHEISVQWVNFGLADRIVIQPSSARKAGKNHFAI